MNSIITVLALLSLFAIGCGKSEPPVVASLWSRAPETITSGDTMKVLRSTGSTQVILRDSWRKYEMFNCGAGKMMSIGFDSVSQIDTMVDLGHGEIVTIQEKRAIDSAFKKWIFLYTPKGKDTIWVR